MKDLIQVTTLDGRLPSQKINGWLEKWMILHFLGVKTNIAPENGWLEDRFPFHLGFGLFSGAFAVSFRGGVDSYHSLVGGNLYLEHHFFWIAPP